MSEARTIAWDWYPGTIPINAVVDETAYVETTFSFHLFHSERTEGLRIGRGASTYLGTMFDVGPRGRVSVGEFALVHGARIVCDVEIEIGNYALISWNVVLMDTRRVPADPRARRRALERAALHPDRRFDGAQVADPIRIGHNVWIGFDACVLPGVTIGEGSIVGARSVVVESVAPYTVVAGNPARVIRQLTPESNKE
jgi:acetyltransferase-like isoleucine patch superfamily enzyme